MPIKQKRTRDKTIKIKHLKYILVNHTDNTATIQRYKTNIASIIGCSVRTLDRRLPYTSTNYSVYKL